MRGIETFGEETAFFSSLPSSETHASVLRSGIHERRLAFKYHMPDYTIAAMNMSLAYSPYRGEEGGLNMAPLLSDEIRSTDQFIRRTLGREEILCLPPPSPFLILSGEPLPRS